MNRDRNGVVGNNEQDLEDLNLHLVNIYRAVFDEDTISSSNTDM